MSRRRGSARGMALRGLVPLVLALVAAAPARAQSPPAPYTGSDAGLAGDEPLHTTLVDPPFSHTLGIHRARPSHLKLFLGDRTTFDDPQGLAAVKFASDDDPERRGDDYQLTLFGVNSGRGEILYNSTMQTLAIFGGEGTGEGRFRAPHGIAATTDGRVYVADTGNERVARLRWDPVARGLEWAGAWAARAPFDVTTDARGQAWATDREAGAVLRFADSTAGAGTGLLAASPVDGDRWPLPDDVEAPLGLAVGDSLDPWYRPRAYRLYLVDRDGARLRGYDAEGRVLAEVAPSDFDRPGGGPGRFFYVALDYFGNVWASDPVARIVYKMDADLEPLAAFPGPGDADSALEEPRGVAIWRRFGQVFVAERSGARYFFVGTDFEADRPVEVRRTVDVWGVPLTTTEVSTVTVAFLDAAGDTLAAADAGTVGTGRVVALWDESGWSRPPAPGALDRADRIAIEARPTYSSRKRFGRVRVLPMVWADGPPAVREEGPPEGAEGRPGSAPGSPRPPRPAPRGGSGGSAPRSP